MCCTFVAQSINQLKTNRYEEDIFTISDGCVALVGILTG